MLHLVSIPKQEAQVSWFLSFKQGVVRVLSDLLVFCHDFSTISRNQRGRGFYGKGFGMADVFVFDAG
jgi:hypothetical protein